MIASTSISSNWAAVLDLLARHHFEVADLGRGIGPPVRLDEPDDDVFAAGGAPPSFVEHRERLADPRRGAEVDAEVAFRHGRTVPLPQPVEREVEIEDVDRLLANDAERPTIDVVIDELADARHTESPRVGHALGLQTGIGDRDVGVEAGGG